MALNTITLTPLKLAAWFNMFDISLFNGGKRSFDALCNSMAYSEMEVLTDEKRGNLLHSAPLYFHYLAVWSKFDTFCFQVFC